MPPKIFLLQTYLKCGVSARYFKEKPSITDMNWLFIVHFTGKQRLQARQTCRQVPWPWKEANKLKPRFRQYCYITLLKRNHPRRTVSDTNLLCTPLPPTSAGPLK